MPAKPQRYSYIPAVIISITWIYFSFFLPYKCAAQILVNVYVKDASTGFNQPFVKITNLRDSSESLSGINGIFQASPGDRLFLEHVLYKPVTWTVNLNDSIQNVYLENLDIERLDLSQDSLGRAIFNQFQDTMKVKGYKLLPYLKYELVNELKLYGRARSREYARDMNDWQRYLSLISIEENISEGPRKNKLRVAYSKTETIDSTIVTQNSTTLIPGYLQNISPLNEYISLGDMEFYNPLHPKAARRYTHHHIRQIRFNKNVVDVVLSLPKRSKRFASIVAILYFDAETGQLKGSTYRPAKSLINWQLNNDYLNLPVMTGLQNNVYLDLHIKKVPRRIYDTRGTFFASKDKFQFKRDSTIIKKTDFRVFQSNKDSVQQVEDEYYNLEPVQESEKLEYLERDTSDQKYLNRKWYDLVVNLALQNLGLKVGSGYFNNIFKINAYELLRIGVGYQSTNLISERLRFGGYFGFAVNPDGINDKGWRLGFNAGIYLGKAKKQYLEYNYKNDVLEPGRTFYLYEKKDLIRNFFTSRMGTTVFNDIAYTSTVNNNFIFRININEFSFDPQFYYWYKTSPEDSINFFRFSEIGFKMRAGRYSTLNPALSRLLLLKKGYIPTLYFNYVKGYSGITDGEFDYHKFNLKLKSYIQFNEKYHIDFTSEAGLSTKEIPYPVAYVGAGNITELASIMVQDAFQTMDLYEYLSDRYVNVFTTFYVNFKASKKNRMRPQVGFAWNMGWGKFNGDINVHVFEEGEGVRDYRDGFYETGILFTNFLQVRMLGLLRGEFGMGVFYNVGPFNEDTSRLAFRATYKITTF
jgi:hypothetical protein